MSKENIKTNKEYKYGFETKIESFKAPKGLSEKQLNLFLRSKKNQNGCSIGD